MKKKSLFCSPRCLTNGGGQLSRLLVLFIVSLTSFTLKGQADRLPPMPAIYHDFYLYGKDTLSFETMERHRKEYIANRDTANLIHMLGYMAAVSCEKNPANARQLTDESFRMAGEIGMAEDDYRLTFSYYSTMCVAGRTSPDTLLWAGNMAAKSVPDSSYFGIAIRAYQANSLINQCAPESEEVLAELEKVASHQFPINLKWKTVGRANISRARYLYFCLKSYEAALPFYQNYFNELPLDDTSLLLAKSSTLGTMALISSRLGQKKKANDLLNQLDTLPIQDYEGSPLDFRSTFEQAVIACLRTGEYERGEQYGLLVVSFFEKDTVNEIGGYRNQMLGDIYGNLAIISLDLGAFEKSRKYLIKSQEAYTDDVFFYREMVYVEDLLGNHARSLELANTGLKKLCLDCGDNPPTLKNKFLRSREINYTLAFLFEGIVQGEYYLATKEKPFDEDGLRRGIDAAKQMEHYYKLYNEEVRGGEKSRFLTNSFLSTGLVRHAALLIALKEATGDATLLSDVFEKLEASKSQILKASLGTSRLPGELGDQEARLARATRRASFLLNVSSPDSVDYYFNRYVEAQTKNDAFWDEIENEYGTQLRQFYTDYSVDMASFQATLPEGVVFLHFADVPLNGWERILTLCVSKTEVKAYCFKNTGSRIESKVANFRRMLKSPLQNQNYKRKELISKSHDIYQDLITSPVEDFIRGNDKLLISTSEVINYLPFELLIPSPEDKPYDSIHFLIKDFAIEYLHSATIRSLLEPVGAEHQKVVAFAPVFDGGQKVNDVARSAEFSRDTIFSGLRGDRYQPLLATEEEVLGIAELYKDVDVEVLLNKGATRKALLAAIKEPSRIVHLATHGLLNEDNYDLSAFACATSPGNTDDLWYAADIRDRNIDADLVVLSSCESGVGRSETGEGLISLNRSFLYAGARNVISTLWKIDDRYSCKLMLKFHQQVAAGKSYAEALRLAKLEMLKNPATSAPRYWAAFLLFGG